MYPESIRERYRGLNFDVGEAQEVISGALKKDKRWGLVIVRCSYASQEQWETFLSLTKAGIRYQLKLRDVQLLDIVGPDVMANLALTVIEDEQRLEGADIQTSSSKWVEWLKEDGVRELREVGELEGQVLDNLEDEEYFMRIPAIPRYTYFIYASADMISSFSLDLVEVEGDYLDDGYYEDLSGGKNYLHVVCPAMLLPDPRLAGEEKPKVDEMYRVEKDDINVNEDISKRVRGGTLSDLYIHLMQSWDHFYSDEEEGFFFVA